MSIDINMCPIQTPRIEVNIKEMYKGYEISIAGSRGRHFDMRIYEEGTDSNDDPWIDLTDTFFICKDNYIPFSLENLHAVMQEIDEHVSNKNAAEADSQDSTILEKTMLTRILQTIIAQFQDEGKITAAYSTALMTHIEEFKHIEWKDLS